MEIEVDCRRPASTEVLVRLRPVGVNPTGRKTWGRGRFVASATTSFVLGFDVPGVIETIDAGMMASAAGDEVFGIPTSPHPGRSYTAHETAMPEHFGTQAGQLESRCMVGVAPGQAENLAGSSGHRNVQQWRHRRSIRAAGADPRCGRRGSNLAMQR